jgi:serine protease AprX
LNLSFGTLSNQAYTVDPLAYAAEVAWTHGVMVIAAAGNDGSSEKQLADPAYDPRIMAVGAYDPNNSYRSTDWTPTDFTNAGSSTRVPDVYAPGVHIMSLRVPGGYVDTNFPDSEVGTRFTRGSGTSQATAVTSGLAADLFERFPNATPDQIKNVLVQTANPFKTSLVGALGNLLTLNNPPGTLNGARAMTKSISSNSSGRQDFAMSKGTGSLEAARGDSHISDGTSDLTGEQDIFGNAWNGQAWATASAAGTSWQGGLWNGQRWSGDNWAGQSWSNATWSSDDWAGQRWSGQRWSDEVWDGQRWSGQRWSDDGWAGQRWRGQRWSATDWS